MRSSDQACQNRIVRQDETEASPPSQTALVFRQQMSLVKQLLLVVFALPWMLPFCRLLTLTDEVQELARPRGDIALVLFAIGLATLAVALSRPSRTVTFDPLAREMVVLCTGAFGPRWQRRCPFRDLGAAMVARNVVEQESYRAEIHCLTRRRPIKIGDFDDERKAREIARHVTTMTSRLVA